MVLNKVKYRGQSDLYGPSFIYLYLYTCSFVNLKSRFLLKRRISHTHIVGSQAFSWQGGGLDPGFV